ncbi:hypothetical protein NA78x_005206 [Anatilimnocola sp. NA78]|uniref:hypothetical protein n=1 Tax=Anatilimnocola sp. NA78 TaxID=3415683 RepID=UPI003CE52A7C
MTGGIFRRMTLASVCIVMVLGNVAFVAAQNKNQPNKKNDEAEIRAAQEKLESAKKEVADAQKDLQAARQQVEKVRSSLIALRRKIEDQVEGSSKLARLRERVDKASAGLQPLVQPILAEVHQSPDYLAAAKSRDELRTQLQNLPAADSAFRPVLAKQIADAEAQLRKLETAAIAQHPQAVQAQEALTQAKAELQTAIDDADEVLGKDPKYAAAKRELDKAENQADQVQARLASKQKAVAAAQNKVQAEIAEERREDAREREQKQKKKNGKKN